MIKKIILIAVNALLLIAFIICLVMSSTIRTSLRSQQAARAWGGQSGERFSQISVFIPETAAFNEDNLRMTRASIDNYFAMASIEAPPDRTLYTEAWSGSGSVSVIGERGDATANAIAVGGDFFLFHPLFLRDGSYISPNDVMRDRVVLDEELAWRLFGSVRISGLEITINTRPFTIAGVISRESDFASLAAYNYGYDLFDPAPASLFMSYEAFSDMLEGEAEITCYEIVMPDPISGFALEGVTKAVTIDGVHIVENTTRFSLGKTFAGIGAFGERSIRTNAIAFPYWENAARYAEDWLALLLFLSLVFIAFPLICGIVYLVKIIRFAIKRGKNIVSKAIVKHDKRAYEKYMLKHSDDVDKNFEVFDVDDIIRESKEENS